MQEQRIEMWVGCFLLAGILALLVLAFQVSGLNNTFSGGDYAITAQFDGIGDLKPRSAVTIAGVRIGQVIKIQLDPVSFKAIVTLSIDKSQPAIPADSSASVFTEGLLGSNYVSITPGYDKNVLKDGGKIEDTHPALVLENLIGQLMFKLNHK